MKKVGNRYEVPRRLQRRRFRTFRRRELVERVDRHELNSRGAIDVFSRDNGEDFFHHTFRARIPIVKRILKQLPLFIEQRVVHPPGIRADAN